MALHGYTTVNPQSWDQIVSWGHSCTWNMCTQTNLFQHAQGTFKNHSHLLCIITEGTSPTNGLQDKLLSRRTDMQPGLSSDGARWAVCCPCISLQVQNIQNGNPARMEEMPWHFPHPSQTCWHLSQLQPQSLILL